MLVMSLAGMISVDLDDYLAEGATFADMAQRVRYLVEPECAVDVDVDVTRDAEVGQRLEVGGSLLHREEPEPATCDPAGDRADRHHP